MPPASSFRPTSPRDWPRREVARQVRIVRGVTQLRAEGNGRLAEVAYVAGSGAEQRLPVDVLALHQGVVPNVNLAMAAGIAHRWHPMQLCWTPVLDADGNSAIDGIAIAGDGAGIGGALAAEARGRLAGRAAVEAVAPERVARLPDRQELDQALARADAAAPSSTSCSRRRPSSASPRATPSCAGARR